MTTMAPIGITVPKLLPIAGTWAVPFVLYNTILSSRIVSTRIQNDYYCGDKLPSSSPTNTKTPPDVLQTATRCHANFLENVPLAFILLIIAELNGGNRKALNYMMGTLFALRIAHAELGLKLQGKFGDNGVGRPLGYFGSIGVLGALGGYCGWLVAGYWGF
ncbi:uncharacterized protein LY89DRAFT_429362 [Mollisia scopiformis]|uniref:Uncharacterized protein n=1 Tax=Mollisia scopiformis TaxID=149040 RepID=A0A194XM81_MOLSC|nr:uncharacterized protein LY89DRAFT_429362 [Mollisia scopiformis]KUJ21194.1 hypothetical protein LY89DRAFT_429362 [Mollisia scopiformis]